MTTDQRKEQIRAAMQKHGITCGMIAKANNKKPQQQQIKSILYKTAGCNAKTLDIIEQTVKQLSNGRN